MTGPYPKTCLSLGGYGFHPLTVSVEVQSLDLKAGYSPGDFLRQFLQRDQGLAIEQFPNIAKGYAAFLGQNPV